MLVVDAEVPNVWAKAEVFFSGLVRRCAIPIVYCGVLG